MQVDVLPALSGMLPGELEDLRVRRRRFAVPHLEFDEIGGEVGVRFGFEMWG